MKSPVFTRFSRMLLKRWDDAKSGQCVWGFRCQLGNSRPVAKSRPSYARQSLADSRRIATIVRIRRKVSGMSKRALDVE